MKTQETAPVLAEIAPAALAASSVAAVCVLLGVGLLWLLSGEHNGTRSLNKRAAVIALESRKFGKTAAYKALSADGRFASWLQWADALTA
jgi:hypothetical protein